MQKSCEKGCPAKSTIFAVFSLPSKILWALSLRLKVPPFAHQLSANFLLLHMKRSAQEKCEQVSAKAEFHSQFHFFPALMRLPAGKKWSKKGLLAVHPSAHWSTCCPAPKLWPWLRLLQALPRECLCLPFREAEVRSLSSRLQN